MRSSVLLALVALCAVIAVASGQSCSGTVVYQGISGVVSDHGTGFTQYTNNLNCGFLISPLGATGSTLISLNWTSFNTESCCDRVRVYLGTSTSGSLQATYQGSTLPSNATYTGSAIFISWTTDGSVTSTGWTVTYSTNIPTCSGQAPTMTSLSGSFSDGVGYYDNNQNCQWLIQPSSAQTFSGIQLDFDVFSLENNYDFVRVYDGSSSSATQLRAFTGTSIPSTTTGTSSSMYVTLSTDSSVTNVGFAAYYQIVPTGYCPSGSTLSFGGPAGQLRVAPAGTSYQNSASCGFLIQPTTTTTSIVIQFSNLNLESNFDFVRVYSGTSSSGTLVTSLTGNVGSTTVTVTNSAAFVQFTTDGSVTRTGWTATYYTPNYFVNGAPGGFNWAQYAWLAGPIIGGSIFLFFVFGACIKRCKAARRMERTTVIAAPRPTPAPAPAPMPVIAPQPRPTVDYSPDAGAHLPTGVAYPYPTGPVMGQPYGYGAPVPMPPGPGGYYAPPPPIGMPPVGVAMPQPDYGMGAPGGYPPPPPPGYGAPAPMPPPPPPMPVGAEYGAAPAPMAPSFAPPPPPPPPPAAGMSDYSAPGAAYVPPAAGSSYSGYVPPAAPAPPPPAVQPPASEYSGRNV